MRVKRLKIALLFFLNLCLILSLLVYNVEAKHIKKHVAEQQADLLVQPRLSKDNLGGQRLGYFNLNVTNKVRTIAVRLFNTTEYPLKVNANIVNATTLDNGSIDYTGANQIDPKLLKVPGNKLVIVSPKITIAARQSKLVKIKVESADFKGVKATAINFTSTPLHQKGSIKNRYVYAVGIILNGHKLTKQYLKRLSVTKIKARFNQAHQANISLKIVNPDASYLMNTKMKVTLQNSKWHFFQYGKSRTEMKVAPNSKFNYDIPLGGMRLVPGLYRLTLETNNNRYHQVIHKYVSITKHDARFINRYNYEYLKFRNIAILVMVLLLVVAILLVTVLRRRRRGKNAALSRQV